MFTRLKYAVIATFLSLPAATLAVDTQKKAACEGAGGTFNGTSCTGASLSLNGAFLAVANTLIFIVGAVSIIMIIIGGLRYVLSSGDASGVKSAKDTILYAIIGVIVALLAYAAVNFVVTRIGAAA